MTYDIHPVAEMFPLIEGKAFDDLVEDIRANGLRDKIEYQGNTILDGRNRLRACKEAGITPEYREVPASVDPIKHIISRNIHRRHLTTSQRAAIAAELANMQSGYRTDLGSNDPRSGPTPLSIDQAADLMSVSAPSVKRAKARMKDDPEAHEAAKRGEKHKTQGADMGSKNRTYRTIGKVARTEYARLTGHVMGASWVDNNIKPIIFDRISWARDHNWNKEISEEQAADICKIVGEYVRQNQQGQDEGVSFPKESEFSRIDDATAVAADATKEIDGKEKSRLERAINAHKRLLDLQLEQRVKERVDEILKLYADEYDRYKAFNDSYTGVFSDEEYRLLISVLHPDRCHPERAPQFAKAFHLIKSKEEILCRVKPNDRPTSLPKTLEELIARGKKH